MPKIHWMTDENHKTYTTMYKTLCGRAEEGGTWTQVNESDIKHYERTLKGIEDGTVTFGEGVEIKHPYETVTCKACQKALAK